jgi:hypothetical protein
MVHFVADKADFMHEFVTEQDLERARCDAAFRQQLMANSLERLLEALKQMRKAEDPSPQAARQLREDVDLAVKLADRLQGAAKSRGPQAA